jgi:hypothetical protein
MRLIIKAQSLITWHPFFFLVSYAVPLYIYIPEMSCWLQKCKFYR